MNEELAREQQKQDLMEEKKQGKKVSRKESTKSNEKSTLANKGKVVQTDCPVNRSKDLIAHGAVGKDMPSQGEHCNLNNNESKLDEKKSAMTVAGAYYNTAMKDNSKTVDVQVTHVTDSSSKFSGNEKAIGIQVQPPEKASPVKKKSFFSRLSRSSSSKSSRKSKSSTRVVYNASVEESAM